MHEGCSTVTKSACTHCIDANTREGCMHTRQSSVLNRTPLKVSVARSFDLPSCLSYALVCAVQLYILALVKTLYHMHGVMHFDAIPEDIDPLVIHRLYAQKIGQHLDTHASALFRCHHIHHRHHNHHRKFFAEGSQSGRCGDLQFQRSNTIMTSW